MLAAVSTLSLLACLTKAQFPPPPVDAHVVTSELDPDVQISYKQIEICETTPGVRSFSGYVHLPQSALSTLAVNFDIHTFFLFFEARNNPSNAPLVIYLAGGPGESSTYTAMASEGGPCYVDFDGLNTTLNPWSLNNDANVLYIDQPVSAGFSYTALINGTFDVLSNTVTPLADYDGSVPEINATFGQGTFSDQAPWTTTNTTLSSAHALWHFAEHWLTQFPEYNSSNKNIGIWGNSYGGFFAPASAALFKKNIEQASNSSSLHDWTIDNVGVTNGALDLVRSGPFSPQFTYNNTYEPLIPEEIYTSAEQNFTKEGGCRDLIQQCRAVADQGDPSGAGTNQTVNAICQGATLNCALNVASTFAVTGRTPFDIAVELLPDGTNPCEYYYPVALYLNQEHILKALGVPLNFTYDSQVTQNAFGTKFNSPESAMMGTGDTVRYNSSDLEYLVQNDVKLALVYGDRDTRCPWLGAEDFAINVNYSDHEAFLQTGYEFITTNDTYQGGAVRQYDGLSFSRVFQAGHMVNAYQPETVYRIFNRTIHGSDVATGEKNATGGYSSSGPKSSFNMINQTLPANNGTCMVEGSFQQQSILELFGAPPSERVENDNVTIIKNEGSHSTASTLPKYW